MSALPCLTNSRPGVSLYAPIGSGGGGIPANPDLTLSTLTAADSVSTTALFVSSINGVAPGGGGVDPAGISTNKIANFSGTTLSLFADLTTSIEIDSSKGGVINFIAPDSVDFNTPDITATGSLTLSGNLAVSSINGNEVAIPYFTSTFAINNVTAVAGSSPADLLQGATFDLLANHHYTAGLSLYYKNEGAGKTTTSAVEFLVGKSQSGDPGGVFSAPAGYSGANTMDGANDCFTWDWVQGAGTTGATIKMTPVDLAGASDFSTTTMIVGGPNIFSLTDWGAL